MESESHVFRLNSSNLKRLASLLQGLSQSSPSLEIKIGAGYLFVQTVPHGLTAKIVDAGANLIHTDFTSLNSLAGRLQEMAQAEPDPDYLVHTHMDTCFTHPAEGLSDIVFQRLDDFHG